MKVVIQRSLNSTVEVDKKIVGSISKGLVLLVGFNVNDTMDNLDYMVNKILKLRIFDDEEGIMNRSILDTGGEILSISQFTLYAETKKSGNRPSYSKAMKSNEAVNLYNEFNKRLSQKVNVSTGVFGENMKVNICNDGPVTIILEN